MVQHRDRFEFNENFLNLVAHHSSSCRFVEFMLDSELERLRAGAPFFSDADDDDGGTLKRLSYFDDASDAMSKTAPIGRVSNSMRPSVCQSASAPTSTVKPMSRIGGGIAPSPPTTPRHAAASGGPKTLTPAHTAAGVNQTVATSTPDGRSSLAPPHAETASISSSCDASTAAVAAYPFFHSLYSYFKYYSNQTPRFHNPYFIDRKDYKVCIHFSAYCISFGVWCPAGHQTPNFLCSDFQDSDFLYFTNFLHPSYCISIFYIPLIATRTTSTHNVAMLLI